MDLRQSDRRPPILLLRSFADDELIVKGNDTPISLLPQVRTSFEEVLAQELSKQGPLIAIGRPGEKLPPPGAGRCYLAHDEWQSEVSEYLRECQRVVVILGTTPGLAWEIRQLQEMNVPEKVILLLPPTGDSLPRWEAARDLFPGGLPPFRGDEIAVTFDAAWGPRVERLHPDSAWVGSPRDYGEIIERVTKPSTDAEPRARHGSAVRACSCPNCGSDDLEPYGERSILDGKRGRRCRACGERLAPRRNRVLLSCEFGLAFIMTGVFLAFFLGNVARAWMAAGLAVGLVVMFLTAQAMFRQAPVSRFQRHNPA